MEVLDLCPSASILHRLAGDGVERFAVMGEDPAVVLPLVPLQHLDPGIG